MKPSRSISLAIGSIFFAALLFACSGGDATGADGDGSEYERYEPVPDGDETDGDVEKAVDGDAMERWEEGEYTVDSVADEPFFHFRSASWNVLDGGIVPERTRRVIAYPGGGAYIGAENGLFRYDPDKPEGERLFRISYPAGATAFNVIDMVMGDRNTLYVLANPSQGSNYWLYRVQTEDFLEAETKCSLGHSATSIAAMGSDQWIYIGTDGPVYYFNGVDCMVNSTSGWPQGGIRSLSGTDDGKLALIRFDGRESRYELHVKDGAWREYLVDDGLLTGQLTSVHYFAEAEGGEDVIWISSLDGLQKMDAMRRFNTFLAQACEAASLEDCGLPWNEIRRVNVSPEGEVWAATTRGAAQYRPEEGRWRFFHSSRWLPEDETTTVGFDHEGGVWIGRINGLTLLYREEWTLEKKADLFLETLKERHIRMNGFSARSDLSGPGDTATAEPWIEQDEALTSGMYALAQTFRAAALDPGILRQEAAAEAWASVHMITELIKATHLDEFPEIEGLPARTIVPRGDGPVDDPEQGEWNRSDYYDWLGDVGPESVVGHTLIYPFYYDLLATKAQKKQIADTVSKLADHLIRNAWRLIDVDGKATSRGHWEDEWVTGDTGKLGSGGLAALELLALLRVAYHITGEKKYWEAYLDRAEAGRYAEAVRHQKSMSDLREGDHAADLLAFLSYLPMLRYADAVQYRKIYMESLEEAWAAERDEHSPLFNFIYGAYAHRKFDLEQAVRYLRQVPPDLVDWRVESCWRMDVSLADEADQDGEPQLSRALAPDERMLLRVDDNPYRCQWGSEDDTDEVGGRLEDDGVFYLLPYWMGRYFGFIEAP